MMSYGKRLLLSNEIFDVEKEIAKLTTLTLDEVNEVARRRFNTYNMSTSIFSKGAKPLK